MIHSSVKIHPQALIDEPVSIGRDTRIWAFAHILPHVVIGDNCNICDHTLIETGVTIGNRVTIKSGVYIWNGVDVHDDVFIGPCVAFTNDKHPRSKQFLTEHPKTILEQGVSVGANATILPGITLGRWSMIGAGSVVTKSVPAHALVFGNPATIKGWICHCGQPLNVNNNLICSCKRQYMFNQNELVEVMIDGNDINQAPISV